MTLEPTSSPTRSAAGCFDAADVSLDEDGQEAAADGNLFYDGD